jgi:hypothetical protein
MGTPKRWHLLPRFRRKREWYLYLSRVSPGVQQSVWPTRWLRWTLSRRRLWPAASNYCPTAPGVRAAISFLHCYRQVYGIICQIFRRQTFPNGNTRCSEVHCAVHAMSKRGGWVESVILVATGSWKTMCVHHRNPRCKWVWFWPKPSRQYLLYHLWKLYYPHAFANPIADPNPIANSHPNRDNQRQLLSRQRRQLVPQSHHWIVPGHHLVIAQPWSRLECSSSARGDNLPWSHCRQSIRYCGRSSLTKHHSCCSGRSHAIHLCLSGRV